VDNKKQMWTRKDYFHAVSEFVVALNRTRGSSIKAIYAGGSFARGDFVPGRSDIDIYVVVKGEKEAVHSFAEEKAAEVERKCFGKLRSQLGQVLSVETTTLDNVQSEGLSWAWALSIRIS